MVKFYFTRTTEKNLFVISNLLTIGLSIILLYVGFITLPLPDKFIQGQYGFFSWITIIVVVIILFKLAVYDIHFFKNRKKVKKWLREINISAPAGQKFLLFCEKITLANQYFAYKFSRVKNSENADKEKLKQKFLAGEFGVGIVNNETCKMLCEMQIKLLDQHLVNKEKLEKEISEWISHHETLCKK